MHISMGMYIHDYIHAYKRANMCICTYTHLIHIYIYTYVYKRMRVLMHVGVQFFMCSLICLSPCTHTYMHVHVSGI